MYMNSYLCQLIQIIYVYEKKLHFTEGMTHAQCLTLILRTALGLYLIISFTY